MLIFQDVKKAEKKQQKVATNGILVVWDSRPLRSPKEQSLSYGGFPNIQTTNHLAPNHQFISSLSSNRNRQVSTAIRVGVTQSHCPTTPICHTSKAWPGAVSR